MRGLISYHVPTLPGRRKHEMAGVFVVFGAGVGKALGFIFPASQRQQ